MKKIVIVEHSEKNRHIAEGYARELFETELAEEDATLESFSYDANSKWGFHYPRQLTLYCGKGGTLVVATIFELIWPKDPDFGTLYDVLEMLDNWGIQVCSEAEPDYNWHTYSSAIRALQLSEKWKDFQEDEG